MQRFVGGKDGCVFVVTEDGYALLGEYEWGLVPNTFGRQLPKPKGYALSKALLSAMGLSLTLVTKHYVAFLHAFVMKLPDSEWTADGDELLEIIEEINLHRKESEADQRRMAREVPKGLALAGGVTSHNDPSKGHPTATWGSARSGFRGEAPTITPNDPKKARYR